MIELEEDPLGPLVVAGVGGVDDPVPVEGVAQHLQLLGEVGDVVVGHLGGVDVVLDGVVLGGQAEGVVAHGEQDVVAVHPALPGHHVHGGVGPGVAHVQALAGGIGELYQSVVLGLGVAGNGMVAAGLCPAVLPFAFDAVKLVFQLNHAFLFDSKIRQN